MSRGSELIVLNPGCRSESPVVKHKLKTHISKAKINYTGVNTGLDYRTAAPLFSVYFHICCWLITSKFYYMPYVWLTGHSSMFFRRLCPPNVVSAPGHTFLSLLPYLSCKTQLKWHMLYVVSHKNWLTARSSNLQLISAHITSIIPCPPCKIVEYALFSLPYWALIFLKTETSYFPFQSTENNVQ